MIERTLAIIKPGAVAAHQTGQMIDLIEGKGFSIVAMQKLSLTREQVEQFYAIHKARPFFGEMVDMMSGKPVVVMVLEKDNAIKEWRDFMGATDPKKALPGTIRHMFGVDIGNNAVHGSDSAENATIEINQFFPGL